MLKTHMNIRLSNLYPEITTVDDFSYAGIDGIAEKIGWNIICFYKKNSSSICAICLEELDSNELKKVADEIMCRLNLEFRIGDPFDKVLQIYGDNYTKNDIYTDRIMYNYKMDDCLIIFGNCDGKIASVEIVFDSDIITNMTSI